MPSKKELRLHRETVAELGRDDLALVGGGCLSERVCVAATPLCVSDFVMSLCGCLTSYCSIDVC